MANKDSPMDIGKISKMKPSTSSGSASSTGSGQTMMKTNAMQDRMAQLSSMQNGRKGFKKKSFDIDSKKMTRSQSNANRDRYFSIATTKKTELKKIENQRQQQREQVLKQQNKVRKKYIQAKSRKNLFDTDDEKKLDSEMDENDAAMILKDEKLSKVDDTAETPLSAAPPTQIQEQDSNLTDVEMKEQAPPTQKVQSTKTTTTENNKVEKNESNANSQQNNSVEKPQKEKPQKRVPQKAPIANPSVAAYAGNAATKVTSANHEKSDSKSRRKNSGFLGNLFKKKDSKKDGMINVNGVMEPKRLKYQLPNSKGEKFELYTWLKPTKLLGEGAYAAVCEVIDERTKKKYAIKKNRDVFSNVADARRILREIKLMIHFDHPHVMSLCGVIPPEPHDRDTYKDCYLIMPRMDTTLSKVIRSKQKLSERHIQYFIYQIARGLEYMHSGGIIHRDLKPENILVNAADCKIKITDFGLSRGVHIDVDSPQKLTEYVVTRWYRAPEVMCCSRLYDYQIDTWALGCISAELYTRRPMFKGRNHIEQLQLIFHFMGTPTDLTWITTEDAKKWISGMPHKDPQDLAKVLPGSTKGAREFVSKLLTTNPHKRPDITTAIKDPWMKDFARDKDYRKCPVFNISFEYEKSIKTAFGVRHMMYTELHNYHDECTKKEEEKMKKYQQQIEN